MLIQNDQEYRHLGGPVVFTISIGTGTAVLHVKKDQAQGFVESSDANFSSSDVKRINLDVCSYKWVLTGDATVAR